VVERGSQTMVHGFAVNVELFGRGAKDGGSTVEERAISPFKPEP
jgi:hypothetical protein